MRLVARGDLKERRLCLRVGCIAPLCAKYNTTMNRDAGTSSKPYRRPQRSRIRGGGSPAAASSTSWQNRERQAAKNEADEATPSSQLLPESETQKQRKSRTGRRILKKRKCSCCESTADHERRPSAIQSTKAPKDEADAVMPSPQLLPNADNQNDGKSRTGRRILKKRKCSCCESTTHHELQPSAIQSARTPKDKVDAVMPSPHLLPKADDQKDGKSRTGRRILNKRNCSCCKSTTHHERQPSTIQSAKATKDEADAITLSPQLLLKADNQKDSKSRTGRRILKGRKRSFCESTTHHEHGGYSAGQSTRANYLCKAASSKVRRRLILDNDQSAATHCAPGFSDALRDDAAPEPLRKCTPAMDSEDDSPDTQLNIETWLMRSTHNRNIKTTSRPQSESACKNTVFTKGQTPMSAFGERVATAPVKTSAGKQTRGRANAATRKPAQAQSCTMSDTKEAASSEVCISRNKVRGTKRQKPSYLSTQSAPKSHASKRKPPARAGPSHSRGSKWSNKVSKPTKVADDAKALKNVSVGAVARRRKKRPGTPVKETACDDMYECKRVAGGIPNHFFEEERWERLSDIVMPITSTPPPNSPHLSPRRAQFSSYLDLDSVPSAVSRKNAMAIMSSMRKRGAEASTLLCSTPKNVKHRNVKKALKGLRKLEEILKQDKMRESCRDFSDLSDDAETEMCLDEEPL